MSALLWSDGNQMLLKNWAAKEMNIEENHCGYINGTDGKWYLDKCANGKNYVCKTTTGKSGNITLHKSLVKPYLLKLGDPPGPIQNGKGYCVAGYDDMIPESDFCYRISPPKRNAYQEETELWSEAEMDCRYNQISVVHYDKF